MGKIRGYDLFCPFVFLDLRSIYMYIILYEKQRATVLVSYEAAYIFFYNTIDKYPSGVYNICTKIIKEKLWKTVI